MTSIEILLVEDDEGHAELVKRNFRRIGLSLPMVCVTGGEEALDYLFCRHRYAHRSPQQNSLVLLDIKMPGSIDGIEVLRQIKSDPDRRNIPVIMLTTTDDPKEINRCYRLGCNVYLTKPIDPQQFVETLKKLGMFIEVVNLPSELPHD